MAIIYSYPLATPKLDDLLIGTSTYDENATVPVYGNPTVSFTLRDVVGMIAPVIGLQDLQSVTTVGNTTSNSVVINNSLSVLTTIKDSSGNVGSAGQLLSSTVTGTSWITNSVSGNYFVTAAAFDTATGILSITGNNAAVGATVDLDGRYLTGSQTITLSGDVSGSGTTTIITTLATVNSNVGAFTNANITVNAKGLITAASSGSSGGVTGSGTQFTLPMWDNVAGTNLADSIVTQLSADNIGIGTTGPANPAKLNIKTPGSALVEAGLRLINPYGFSTIGCGSKIVFAQDTIDSENYEMATIQSSQTIGGDISDFGDLSFYTREFSLTEKMRITTGGEIQLPENGSSLQFRSSGSINYTKISRDATNQLRIQNTATIQIFGIEDSGDVNFNSYGSGTITGTPTYNLSVDSAGKIIETANPSGGSGVTVANITVTASQLIALAVGATETPVTLIAAPGAGKGFNIQQVYGYLDAGSAAFNFSGGTVAIQGYAQYGTGMNIPIGGFLNTIAGGLENLTNGNGFNGDNPTANTSMILRCTPNGGATAGNGTLYISIAYKVIDIGPSIQAGF